MVRARWQRDRGATLVELLVVVGVFAVLMTLVMGFYIYGIRVSQKRDGDSDRYRRAVTVLNKMETRLSTSWVYGVTPEQDAVVFSPMGQAELAEGRIQRPRSARTLLVKEDKVLQVVDEREEVLAQLTEGESLRFEAPDGQLGYLDMHFEVPAKTPDQSPTILTRRVLLEGF